MFISNLGNESSRKKERLCFLGPKQETRTSRGSGVSDPASEWPSGEKLKED